MAAAWAFIYALIAICFCNCKASSYPVPLLIWSSKSINLGGQVIAGHTLNYEDIQEKYLDKLKTQSNVTCVFVQNKLSIDDFAVNPGMHLKHLKKLLNSSLTSIVLPSVSLNDNFQEARNNKLVKYLEKNSHGAIVSLAPQDINEFPNKIRVLPTNVRTVFLVHLPEAKNGEDSAQNLQSNDEIIGKVAEALSTHFPDYVAMLTANMPNDYVQSGMADSRLHTRVRRFTTDDDDSKALPCNHSGVMVQKNEFKLYIIDISLSRKNYTPDTFKNDTSLLLPENQITIANLSLNGLRVSFPLNGVFKNNSKITMSLTFNRTNIRWWCESIDINGSMQNTDGKMENIGASYNNCRDKIDVPYDKSFACQVKLNFSDNIFSLVFYGIQLQPYFVNNGTFHNTYDCIGFFTPPIWMGLITMGVFIAILYGGMLALLSIKSMDRFDNPKDPVLVINSE